MIEMKKIVLFSAVFFLIGGALGWLVFSLSATESEYLEVRAGGYAYINPLLECEVNGGLESKDLQSFKNDVSSFVNTKVKSQDVSEVSVYYRDLNNGPWFGINEDSNFAPQSLLKVPVLIAYLKIAESSPDILEELIQLEFQEEATLQPNLDERLTDGESYTVNELLRRMIVLSDNDAFYNLLDHIDYAELEQVHVDLGLTLPTSSLEEDFVSVKSYASLFRVLYNSSYLNRSMSEYALSLLAQSTYANGLRGEIPRNVSIAHKFGIRNLEDQGGINQLHDCGIIYKSEKPYLLCVMTRGNNLEVLETIIQGISNIVFDKVQ